jgi:sugar phosphate isomerase/epimerase
MPTQRSFARRRFLAGATGAATSAALGFDVVHARSAAAADAPPRWPIIAFSKPFTHLSFDETADLVAEVGWDGIECPVRNGNSTHIKPERAAEDLPRMVDALRKRGKELSVITTSIVKPDAAGESLLRTAAALGIRRVRLGFLKYPPDAPPAKQVAEFRDMLADLAALTGELGIQAGYQNHSGSDFIGAPLWDLWTAMKDIDPRHVGVCFDIGHATIEGGLSWPVQARLLADRFVAVFCKDFYWERKRPGQKLAWCPWGEGAVDRSFFTWLRKTGFQGPLCQHHEYDLGTGPEMVAHFKRDLAALRLSLAP